MRKALAVSILVLLVFALPTASASDVAEDCVSIEIQEKPEHSCRHPNPFLAIFMSAPVYFTVVDNQCGEPIEIASILGQGGKEYVGYASAKARSKAEIVGCGEPAKLLGWYFAAETDKGKCPDDALRGFD